MDGRRSSAWRAAALATVATLGGCTTSPRPPRLVVPRAPAPAPLPPAGASANLVLPEKDAAGHYRTPNLGIGPAAIVWHVRSALNVAALSCRGPAETTLIADYNRLLAGKRALLAAAFARTEAEARAKDGKQWRDVHDRQMTRLYNFFAQPPAKAAFCTVAVQVAAEAAATPPAAFQAFADAALPRLEAPFLDFYARYDAYRSDLAAWRAEATQATPLAYAPIASVLVWTLDPTARSGPRLAATDSAPRRR